MIVALFAAIAGGFVTTSAALADCGPDAPPGCTCVYVGELPLEFYPTLVRPVLTPLYPQFTVPTLTVPTALTPVESYAGTLEINLPGLFPAPETFLVAPLIATPVVTFINPTPVETFVVNTLSPITWPTFSTLNLSPTILPTTGWSPSGQTSSGVLEYHGSANLTFIMPDLSYLLPGYNQPTVPEPTTILIALLVAPFVAHRHRYVGRRN